MTNIAVEGLTYLLSPPASEAGSHTANISPASAKVKLTGKGVYRGPTTFTFPSGTINHPQFTASQTNTAPAVFTISPKVLTKVKADGMVCLAEGDESPTVIVNGLMNSGDSVVPTTASVTLKIQVAGQIKGKAN